MRQCLLLTIACLLTFTARAAAAKDATDSLLAVLDTVITNTPAREAAIRERLARHTAEYRSCKNVQERFACSRKVYHDYYRLQLDSALVYARIGVGLARQMGDAKSLVKAQLTEAEALKCLAHNHEALDVLNGICRDMPLPPAYYFQYHSNLLSLYESASTPPDRLYYKKLLRCYRDSINIVGKVDSVSLRINQSEILKLGSQYRKAIALLEQTKRDYPSELSDNAVYWFSLGETYEKVGDTAKAKYCYTMAAIIDKRRCSKTYISLQHLAKLLYKEGDIEHAYHYIRVSLDDVISSGARWRLVLVTEYLPIITSAYEHQQRLVAEKRNIIIGMVSLSAIIMALLLLLLYKNYKRLAAMRRQLVKSNKKLCLLNEELSSLNDTLKESNKIKEVYIAQLFHLCSENIDQMEHLRLSVAKKLKAGLYKELAKKLEQSTTNATLKSFFSRFDAVFLELFPDFIERFNALLLPGEELKVKEGALLSPELRIFALIRLGITDSTKIAGFLHYSTQTVYNYRQKVKNKARSDKESFMEQVRFL